MIISNIQIIKTYFISKYICKHQKLNTLPYLHTPILSMITQKTIHEIIETAKIEEVVGDFVSLKKRGVNLLGLCPFHNEKTPSFNVNPTRNIYKCFGCGKGGDPVSFLMEHDNLTYPEALRYLAQKYNIEIEESTPSPEYQASLQENESLYIINQYAGKYFTDQLFQTDIGKSVGLGYLKKRGFREDTIKKFDLGFSSAERDGFTRKAVKEGYNIELMRKVGLTTASDNDFFRNRVIFPIHSLSGKLAAFAGRILTTDAFGPKYLNSPESEIYNKSKTLYGLFQAKQSIRKHDECILVEGYTDVISLHQGGVENVVASSGTSLTIEQIRLIKRYTQNILILYDGDPAGIKAAVRGIELIVEQDANVKIALLPDKHDPDSFFKEKGHTGFLEYLNENKKDFLLFRLELASKEIANDPIRKSAFIREMIETLAKIPDAIKRAVYVKECSLQLKIKESLLVNEINKLLVKNISDRRNKIPQPAEAAEEDLKISAKEGDFPEAKESTSNHFPQEKDLIRVLMKYCDRIFEDESGMSVSQYIYDNVKDILEYFDTEFYKQIILDLKLKLDNAESIDPDYYLKNPDEKIKQFAIDIFNDRYTYSPNWKKALQTQKDPEDNYKNDCINTTRILKYRKFARISEEYSNKLKGKTSEEEEEVTKILKVQIKLQKLKSEMGDLLNYVVF